MRWFLIMTFMCLVWYTFVLIVVHSRIRGILQQLNEIEELSPSSITYERITIPDVLQLSNAPIRSDWNGRPILKKHLKDNYRDEE
jgi:hypothetical protein